MSVVVAALIFLALAAPAPAAAMARNGQSPATDSAVLSPAERAAIGKRIRDCWASSGPATPGAEPEGLRLRITTDPSGTVQTVQPVGPASILAESAVHAALDPRCVTLPPPPALLGRSHAFDITFRP